MIARIWHGMVPVSKADEYLDLMRRIALSEYLATRGNRGAWCLYRTEADVTHFEMQTFWDDTDAIKRFARDDFSMAKYYNFDASRCLRLVSDWIKNPGSVTAEWFDHAAKTARFLPEAKGHAFGAS